MCKNIQVLRLFLAMLIMLNCIIAIPLYQTEIQFSKNFDNVGSVGKFIDQNIDKNASIAWDQSSMAPPWDGVFFSLIDYWVRNNVVAVDLVAIASENDSEKLENIEYIITMHETNVSPIYISNGGFALYRIA